MSEIKFSGRTPAYNRRRQRGAAAVEFGLISILFFTVLFGVIEFARLMFVFNTLPEVTRRAASAAAGADFTNSDAINEVQWKAIFRTSAGGMVLMDSLTDQSIRIDYLTVTRNSDGTFSMAPIPSALLPASPAENRRLCLIDPNGPSCIRIVRARVCKPTNPGACEPMQFQSLLPLVGLTLALPTSPTLVKAGSFGL